MHLYFHHVLLLKRIPTASLKTSLRTLVPTEGETLAPNLTRAAKNFFVLSINVSGFADGPLNSLQNNHIFSRDCHQHPSISFSGGPQYFHKRGLTRGLWRFSARGWRVEPSVWGAQRQRGRGRRWSRTPRTRPPLLPTHPPPSPPWWTSARSSRPWNWKYKQHVAAALRFKKDKVASTFEFEEQIQIDRKPLIKIDHTGNDVFSHFVTSR